MLKSESLAASSIFPFDFTSSYSSSSSLYSFQIFSISAFQPFSLSAFQPFSLSAFQPFSLSAFQPFSLSAFQLFTFLSPSSPAAKISASTASSSVFHPNFSDDGTLIAFQIFSIAFLANRS